MAAVVLAFAVVLPLTIFGLVVLAVATGVRRVPDPAGSRPRALGLYAVAYATILIVVFAIVSFVAAIVRIILPTHEPRIPVFGGGVFPTPGSAHDKEFTNQAVLSALVALAALAVLLFVYRRATEALSEPGWLEGEGFRVRRAYLWLQSVVWILIALFAAVFALYGLYKVILPGTAGLGFISSSSVRDSGITELVSLAVLTVLALVVFAAHWRRLHPSAGPFASWWRRPAAPAPTSTTSSTEPIPPATPGTTAP
jgi:hypothetical protein